MRSVLEIHPTSNYRLASARERSDQMQSLARVLMGINHPIQFVSRTREVKTGLDWTRPPRLARSWFAVVAGDDPEWLASRLAKELEGVGFRCREAEGTSDQPVTGIDRYRVELSGDRLAASLVLRRWPREVAPGWLGNALASDIPVDVGIHIQPQDAQQVSRWLKRQQQNHAQDNLLRPDPGTQLGHDDAQNVRRALIARTDRPVRVAVVLTVYAPDKETLTKRVMTVQHEIGLALGDARPATFEHDRGFEATALSGVCRLEGAWRTLDCTSVASMWPFQPTTVAHAQGAEIGTTRDGSMLARLDPFDLSLESFGGIVVAKVGAGKTYFLSLIAMRLRGVEVWVVEQRDPPEFAAIDGVHTFNLADVPLAERATRLREFVMQMWERAKADPRPRLLILDELWSLLLDPDLAATVAELARIGRHHYLSLWIATQQVSDLLDPSQGPYGMAVLNNAAIRVYLKQHGPDGDLLADKMRISPLARQFLRSAGRGQALLDVGGMLVAVDIQATPDEHRLISTDPRERRERNNGIQSSGADPAARGGGAVSADAEDSVLGVRRLAAVGSRADDGL